MWYLAFIGLLVGLLAGLHKKLQADVAEIFREARLGPSNNNNNNNSHDNVYGAVIVAVHCHCESSPGSSDECSTQRQVAANLWTKPISLSQ